MQTHKQPVTEYEAIREKAATQKRDMERALTKFLAKTSETHNLFNTEDNQVFPCKYKLLEPKCQKDRKGIVLYGAKNVIEKPIKNVDGLETIVLFIINTGWSI